jgi:hypothetical protein
MKTLLLGEALVLTASFYSCFAVVKVLADPVEHYA